MSASEDLMHSAMIKLANAFYCKILLVDLDSDSYQIIRTKNAEWDLNMIESKKFSEYVRLFVESDLCFEDDRDKLKSFTSIENIKERLKQNSNTPISLKYRRKLSKDDKYYKVVVMDLIPDYSENGSNLISLFVRNVSSVGNFDFFRKSIFLRKLFDKLVEINTCSNSSSFIKFLDPSDFDECYKDLIDTINKTIEVGNTKYLQEQKKLEIVHDIIKSGNWEITFDGNGNINTVYWSQEFRNILGFNSEIDFPNVLESWSDRIYPADKDFIMENFFEAINDYSGKKKYDYIYRARTINGEYRWFRDSGEIIRDKTGKPLLLVGIFIDVTQQKEHELLIQDKLQSAEILKHALAESEKANNSRNEFISSMSHDMKTPLNGIVGMTELAKKHIYEPEKLIDYLEKIATSSSLLLNLVNEILEMNKLNSNKSIIEENEFRISDLINEISSVTKGEIEQHGHNITFDISHIKNDFVIGDVMKIKKILLNIIGNAIKYTPNNGIIYVEAYEDEEIVFVVEDNGIGMSEDFLKVLFDPFVRAEDSKTNKVSGTGLGMSITKKLVKLLGGNIEVYSKIGEGSKFIVSLPLRHSNLKLNNLTLKSDKSIVEHICIENLDFSGKKILLVEDNEINCEIVKELLSFAKLEVDIAVNGEIAIEKMKKYGKVYSLIFMDIQMPVMDGYKATESIRAINSNIPIIAMSANAFPEDIQRAKKSGMNDYVSKPINVDELVKTLQKWMK